MDYQSVVEQATSKARQKQENFRKNLLDLEQTEPDACHLEAKETRPETKPADSRIRCISIPFPLDSSKVLGCRSSGLKQIGLFGPSFAEDPKLPSISDALEEDERFRQTAANLFRFTSKKPSSKTRLDNTVRSPSKAFQIKSPGHSPQPDTRETTASPKKLPKSTLVLQLRAAPYQPTVVPGFSSQNTQKIYSSSKKAMLCSSQLRAVASYSRSFSSDINPSLQVTSYQANKDSPPDGFARSNKLELFLRRAALSRRENATLASAATSPKNKHTSSSANFKSYKMR